MKSLLLPSKRLFDDETNLLELGGQVTSDIMASLWMNKSDGATRVTFQRYIRLDKSDNAV